MLTNLRMNDVFSHYQRRIAAQQRLRGYFSSANIQNYVDLALGISDPAGNYSAAEHGLGPQVLSNSRPDSVFALARDLDALSDSNHVPDTIYRANLPYLRISLGSEMAMMLRPEAFWVGNVRTVYSHLLLKHHGNQTLADEELRLYREPDGARPSQMEYRIWRDIYLALESSLREISRMGHEEAQRQNAQSGTELFIWADTICSHLYEKHV
ncbi:hypothetical protein [Nitrogeniibacter aestuarii]|uniref:hypothetical protein n=1 Tax=Nitrogeniibacter aestuarii TaxID=2815343 RepID=UPI001E51A4C6|nr:hypothetical protein [Nitrogeniibacter aestuarii]